MVSISIVSHDQAELVTRLLASFEHHEHDLEFELILIENSPHGRRPQWEPAGWPAKFVANEQPQGLARNWNACFERAAGEYFCLLNPDLIFVEPVLGALMASIRQGLGDIVAPAIFDPDGRLLDFARDLPTPWSLLVRRLRPGYAELEGLAQLPDRPDWIAGTFLLMRSEVYQALGGMDERYHLYFEDVDFCTRARLAGLRLWVSKQVRIVHEPRRRSRRHPRHLAWHMVSAMRFLSSPVYRRGRRLRRE